MPMDPTRRPLGGRPMQGENTTASADVWVPAATMAQERLRYWEEEEVRRQGRDRAAAPMNADRPDLRDGYQSLKVRFALTRTYEVSVRAPLDVKVEELDQAALERLLLNELYTGTSKSLVGNEQEIEVLSVDVLEVVEAPRRPDTVAVTPAPKFMIGVRGFVYNDSTYDDAGIQGVGDMAYATRAEAEDALVKVVADLVRREERDLMSLGDVYVSDEDIGAINCQFAARGLIEYRDREDLEHRGLDPQWLRDWDDRAIYTLCELLELKLAEVIELRPVGEISTYVAQ